MAGAHRGKRVGSWGHLPQYKARAMVYSALRTMRRSEGGPFTNREIAEIVKDVMEIPDEDCDVSTWDGQRCKTLILRLLVRGLIHDPHFAPGAAAVGGA